MTQLTLDAPDIALALPESRKGGYSCTTKPLFTDVEMASGRLTRELRGYIYTLSYQYGYLDDEGREKFIAACEKGWREPIECIFLTQSNEEMSSFFLVTDFTFPKFMWSRTASGETVPLWGDFRVTLREVDPHD